MPVEFQIEIRSFLFSFSRSQEQVIGMCQQPSSVLLGEVIFQARSRPGVGIDDESAMQQRFELGAVLRLNRNALRERDIRRCKRSSRELDGAVEVLTGTHHWIARTARTVRLVIDEKNMDCAIGELLIQLERAVDQGLDDRQIGDEL